MCPDLTPEKIFGKWSELHDTDPNEGGICGKGQRGWGFHLVDCIS